MMQMMQNKITAEGKREEELMEKFLCYCETSSGTLAKSIDDAKTKIPQLESDIKEAEAMKAQLEQDIEDAKKSRADANAAMEKATALREKENKEFAAESTEDSSNIDALGKAIAAIEKGMAGSFLQTPAASRLKRVVQDGASSATASLSEYDRGLLASFLSEQGRVGYAPASGEIVGMLKQMKDTMEKDLADAKAAEAEALATYEELMAAKKKEIEACTAEIEEKLQRLGNSAVEVAQMKNDLEDTQESLAEDTKFLADLEKNCAAKEKEWAEICKMRQEELIALADTIKILNDDDALELFKKTLPSSAASLVQMDGSAAEMKRRALALVQSG